MTDTDDAGVTRAPLDKVAAPRRFDGVLVVRGQVGRD